MIDTLRPARPVHPGRILRRELDARGMTRKDLWEASGLSRTRIRNLLAGYSDVDEGDATRLSNAFGTSAEIWLNLQTAYDEAMAQGEKP